jgi:hypothetical protein
MVGGRATVKKSANGVTDEAGRCGRDGLRMLQRWGGVDSLILLLSAAITESLALELEMEIFTWPVHQLHEGFVPSLQQRYAFYPIPTVLLHQ